MRRPERLAERSIATFLFGAVAFSPPILSIFGADVSVFGLPLLYTYLFAMWCLIIAMVAWIADFGLGRPSDHQGRPRAGHGKTD